jgi:hypothetical protein
MGAKMGILLYRSFCTINLGKYLTFSFITQKIFQSVINEQFTAKLR